MQNKLLTKARDLDKVLRESNEKAFKQSITASQSNIENSIYESLYKIRDCMVDIIFSFDERDAQRNIYDKEYHNLIKHWDEFTSKNVSPQEAGVKLERVRQANLFLISTLEKN